MICLLYLFHLIFLILLIFLNDAVDILKKQAVDKLPNDLEGMEASLQRLLALIDDVYKYVDSVVVSRRWNLSHRATVLLLIRVIHTFCFQEGHTPADNSIGRFLADTVASIPEISAFDKLANDSIQVRLKVPLLRMNRSYY